MDRAHTLEQRAEVLAAYIQKLTDSSYNVAARREILKSGVARYYRMLKDQATGGPRIYRSAKEMEGSREIKEIVNQNWFRRARGGTRARENKDAPQKKAHFKRNSL